jgi:hypothetical protein
MNHKEEMQRIRRRTYHLDLHQCFIAIVQEISRFATVDAYHAEKKLATQAKRKRGLIRSDDGFDAVLQVVLQNVCLGELALHIR